MAFPDLLEQYPELAEGIGGKLTANQPLSAVTWFRTGGPAQLMFQPADEDDLAAFLKKLPKDIPVLPVGLGSNLLIRDGGLKGVVIRLSAKGFGFIEEVGGNRLKAGAAVPDKGSNHRRCAVFCRAYSARAPSKITTTMKAASRYQTVRAK